jgi:hypothetical protein
MIGMDYTIVTFWNNQLRILQICTFLWRKMDQTPFYNCNYDQLKLFEKYIRVLIFLGLIETRIRKLKYYLFSIFLFKKYLNVYIIYYRLEAWKYFSSNFSINKVASPRFTRENCVFKVWKLFKLLLLLLFKLKNTFIERIRLKLENCPA